MFDTFTPLARRTLLATFIASSLVASVRAENALTDTSSSTTSDDRDATPAHAPPASTDADVSEESWNAHAQTTYVWQHHYSFHAPYSGPQSLSSHPENSYTWTGTVFLGGRPWKGGELYFNPEFIVGTPFSHLYGLASISNGEIQKNGGPRPRGYKARWFLRQVFNLGGDSVHVEGAANQLASNYDSHRLVFTAGKVTLTDIFEKNTYANDPRSQFLNWSMITYGAWDYAADARAYTIGYFGELYWDQWVVRLGHAMEPTVANGDYLNHHLDRYHGDEIEVEHDHQIGGLPGLLRVLAFRNRAWAGNYMDAISAAEGTGLPPDVTSVRKDAVKVGYGISFEQRLSDDIGMFARVSSANDRIEEYAFTEIDNDFSAGISMQGSRWGRADDVLGVAFSSAGLNRQHRAYLAAGGLGGFLGDGQLTHYGRENVLEAYYNYRVAKGISIGPDLQLIENPGYNADRHGPVTIVGARLHLEI
ncbi:carbohydrate porin [Dyella sp. 20L07]|uniref:carbohydrate porin n=1 Tax=Dyella sp. 20L07 TaxID=3384240 RepID=UPI003D2ACF0C